MFDVILPLPSYLFPSVFNILPLPCYLFPSTLSFPFHVWYTSSLPHLIHLVFHVIFSLPQLICFPFHVILSHPSDLFPSMFDAILPLPCYPSPSMLSFPIRVSFPFHVILSLSKFHVILLLLRYSVPAMWSFPFHIWWYCFPSLSHYPFKPNLQPVVGKKFVQRRNVHTTHTYRTIRPESNCGPATLLRLSSCTCLTFAECHGVKIAHAFLYAAVTDSVFVLSPWNLATLSTKQHHMCSPKMVHFCQPKSK